MPDLDLTDLEQRLARLAEHAATGTMLPAAPAIRRRAARARRRRAGAVALAGLAAAAVVAAVVVPLARPDAAPAPTPAGRVSPSPGVPLATTPAVGDRRVAVSPTVSVLLPDGWALYRNGGQVGTSDPQFSCLAPVRPWLEGRGCPGLSFQAGPGLLGYELGPYRAHQASGWYTGTDVEPCPAGPVTATFNAVTDTGGAPVDRGLVPVGSHRAIYDRWRATCQDGTVFFPQAWYLPTEQLLVKKTVPVPGAEGEPPTLVLPTLAFASDQPDGQREVPRGLVGRLVAAAPGEVEVAVDGTGVRYRLADTTACLGGTRLAGTSYDVSAVDCSRFADWLSQHHGQQLPVSLYVLSSGEVAQLAER